MSEQAAPAGATRRYVILEQVEDEGTWKNVGKVPAASRASAIKNHSEHQAADWTGGTLIAIPEGSWVPTSVRVETKRNVTLG